jgi:hypothetical protein
MPRGLAIPQCAGRLPVLHDIADDKNFRNGRVTTFLMLLGMNDKLTEVAREPDLLIIGDARLPEANDPIFQPGFADGRDIVAVAVCEIKAFDIGRDTVIERDGGNSLLYDH